MKTASIRSASTSRAAAHDDSHGKALQAPAQFKPAYKKIDYDFFKGDTATCCDYRYQSNNWHPNTNLGLKSGADQSKIKPGITGKGHSEEKVLEEETGVKIQVSDDAKEFTKAILNKYSQGVKLDLYTELTPCSGNHSGHHCTKLLNAVLTDDSTVFYSADTYSEKKKALENASQLYDEVMKIKL